MCPSSHLWLDLKIGVPAKITSDRPVQVLYLGCVVFSPEHFLFQDHKLPSSVQPPHRMFSLFPEDLSRLVWPLYLGNAQPLFYSTGWVGFLRCYGASLCLPGEFLDSDKLPSSEFLERIQSVLRGLVLPPPHHQAPSAALVPAALASAEFVFVRKDASVQPLSQLYHSPFKVLAWTDKLFTLQMGSRYDTVSMDCLKPSADQTLFLSSPMSRSASLSHSSDSGPVPGPLVPVPGVPAVPAHQNSPWQARFSPSSPRPQRWCWGGAPVVALNALLHQIHLQTLWISWAPADSIVFSKSLKKKLLFVFYTKYMLDHLQLSPY